MDMVKRGDMMDIEDIIDILAIDLLGVIPDDENIIISSNKGEPIVMDERSLAGQAYRNLVERLLGNNVPLINLDVGNGFMDRLKKLFKLA